MQERPRLTDDEGMELPICIKCRRDVESHDGLCEVGAAANEREAIERLLEMAKRKVRG